MIHLSKRKPGAPRYVAEHRRGRLVWWESPTGKVADLQLIAANAVPRKVRKQIARARYRTRTRT